MKLSSNTSCKNVFTQSNMHKKRCTQRCNVESIFKVTLIVKCIVVCVICDKFSIQLSKMYCSLILYISKRINEENQCSILRELVVYMLNIVELL